MDSTGVSAALKSEASQLGFSLVGVSPAVTPSGFSHLREWLDRGFAGEMHYLWDRREAYADPNRVLDGVRSVIMLALPYRTHEPATPRTGQGRVSQYAWGPVDYHDVIHTRLKRLSARLRECEPNARIRGVVDTAPLLERDFAQRAGLGWIGKNTMLINRGQGSWFFLAALLTDLELDYDVPTETDHCGTCRLCLDACPTQAFPAPYVLDATRCISYLTIELRGPIPESLRAGMGDWAFGCDICQDVCPWNRKAPSGDDGTFGPKRGRNPLELSHLFELDESRFRAQFRGSALSRPRRSGLLRNAAIVLGNQRAKSAVPSLTRGLQDEDPIIRGACAWALGQIGGPAAGTALADRLTIETIEEVRTELQSALNRLTAAAESPHDRHRADGGEIGSKSVKG